MIFETKTGTQSISKEQVWAAWKHGVRYLGIPTVCDRVAQQVIRTELEAILEPKFCANSFGSRPGRSAHQAVEQCAKHCWERWYVLSVDIKGFFDNLDHVILMNMLRKHTDKPHILLYCQRWLNAPVKPSYGCLPTGAPDAQRIAGLLAPRLQGWINYYGHFRLSAMSEVFDNLNYRLLKWVKKKYKYTSYRKAERWLKHKMACYPNLFVHWKYGFTT